MRQQAPENNNINGTTATTINAHRANRRSVRSVRASPSRIQSCLRSMIWNTAAHWQFVPVDTVLHSLDGLPHTLIWLQEFLCRNQKLSCEVADLTGPISNANRECTADKFLGWIECVEQQPRNAAIWRQQEKCEIDSRQIRNADCLRVAGVGMNSRTNLRGSFISSSSHSHPARSHFYNEQLSTVQADDESNRMKSQCQPVFRHQQRAVNEIRRQREFVRLHEWCRFFRSTLGFLS